MPNRRLMSLGISLLLLFWTTMRFGIGWVEAERKSDITNTKHNLSTTGPGTTKTSDANMKEICVFCHTPHNASTAAKPLWNRALSTQTYTNKYNKAWSASLDADDNQGGIGDPAGSSKLCLSCHDGSLNIGSVNVLGGKPPTGDIAGLNITMPTGTDGYTRNLGTDLQNDHPISVTYNDALATKDGELRKPSSILWGSVPTGDTYYKRFNTLVGMRSGTTRPILKLEDIGGSPQIQCATCHDPHLRETSASAGNQKFLRLNRFQMVRPASTGFSVTNDIICLACHDRNNDIGGGPTETGSGAWAFSAHANPDVADETYKSGTSLDNREFPAALPVWQAACLNCHDTHTVQGAKKLLREGVSGGSAAQEQVCFKCHGNSPIIEKSAVAGGDAPNIEKDFNLTRKMPITGTEKHDIGGTIADGDLDCAAKPCGKDLIEKASNLGTNRHVECTDCHNPHRVIKAQNGFPGALSSSNTKDGRGTHLHVMDGSTQHTNLISGVLRGSWGVEPSTYASNSFHSRVSTWKVKRGDPGSVTVATLPADPPYVTKEYQICLKCHSSYAYGSTPPSLSVSTPAWDGVTLTAPVPRNGMTKYTDQAKEFQAPSTHVGEPLSVGSDGGAGYNAGNHRSWHPVMAPTGRTLAKRGITRGSKWRQPWTNFVGAQTMYCTDCHGSATAVGTVVPSTGENWGPHGSGNDFLLKGKWNSNTGGSTASPGKFDDDALCFRCHDYLTYAMGYTQNQGWGSGVDCKNSSGRTGFSGGGGPWDLHCEHQKRLGAKNSNSEIALRCSWCHVAVPHGWKNKALLVNLNDIGEELGAALAGLSKEVSTDNGAYYTKEPYYLRAKNKIRTFASSGNWSDTSCGSAGKTNTNLISSADASFGANTGAAAAGSNNTNTGKSWMQNACTNAP